jgi:hypothetical protein
VTANKYTQRKQSDNYAENLKCAGEFGRVTEN